MSLYAVGMAVVAMFFVIIWASIVVEVFKDREEIFGPHQ